MTTDHGARRGLRALAVSLALALGVSFLATTAASAATQPTPAQLGARWLSTQIQANNGFIESFGVPDPTNTAYAVIGLHAANVGPQAANEAIAYLKTQLGAGVQSGGTDAPGALSYFIMAAVASGIDPHQFGGTAGKNNLVNRLLATQRLTGPDKGLFGAQDPTFDGAFREGLALAALQAAGLAQSEKHVAAAITWLKNQQCANGLWMSYRTTPFQTPCPPADPNTFTGPDTNSTAMAMQGLGAWNVKPHRPDVLAALHAVQSSDAGFPFVAAANQTSDPDSTALVLQALLRWGAAPGTAAWTVNGATPSTALVGFQLRCGAPAAQRGAFFFPGDHSPNVLATVQAVPAAANRPLPIAASTTLQTVPPLTCP